METTVSYLFFVVSHCYVLLFCNPMDCSLLGSSVHGISQQEYWSGFHFLLQGSFQTQGSNPGLCVSCIAGRFFIAEPPEKPIKLTFEAKSGLQEPRIRSLVTDSKHQLNNYKSVW